jgi:hypothetical protein
VVVGAGAELVRAEPTSVAKSAPRLATMSTAMSCREIEPFTFTASLTSRLGVHEASMGVLAVGGITIGESAANGGPRMFIANPW